MNLFVYKGKELSLYKDEILLYPELNAILSRDKGSVGDSDGRKKLQAWKEFTYLYMICDYASYPNQKGMNEQEAHKYAIDIAELPEKWIPDKVILDAMDFYVDANMSVAKEVAKELLASFKNSTRVVKKLRDTTNVLLDKSSLNSVESGQLADIQQTIMAISTSLPKHLKALKESEDLIKKEDKEGIVGRGGEQISDSQNPDTAIG